MGVSGFLGMRSGICSNKVWMCSLRGGASSLGENFGIRFRAFQKVGLEVSHIRRWRFPWPSSSAPSAPRREARIVL
eukprot:556522-Pyramimonas_sp.AAC.1